MSEKELLLGKVSEGRNGSLFRDAQTRYTYFLLAAAGAGIGLAVNQTQNAQLLWSQLPLAGAVLSWGFSFFFGCRQLLYMTSALYSNFALIKVVNIPKQVHILN